MKRLIPILTLLVVIAGAALAQVTVSRAYNVPGSDAVLSGISSVRGAAVGHDIDGDGKKEIAVTNYLDQGHVHVFEVIGDDSLELVWSSNTLSSGGGGSTPRYVAFGDLDNDGRGEVIFQSNNVGVLVYEWDGVTGSDNYGDSASAIIGSAIFAGLGGNAEYFEVTDVDGDGDNELLIAYNGSSNDLDRYYVVSATGDWNTNDPGFSSFTLEYQALRTELADWGIGGGSPYAMISAQFDGTGNKEILIHNWNLKNISPMIVPSANTYQLADTNGGKGNLYLSAPNDFVALFGGVAADVNMDGREEVYLPSYRGSSTEPAYFHVVNYEGSENTSKVDTFNVTALDLSSVMGGNAITTFGAGWGDIDGDGKREVYTSSVYPYNLVAIEFQGGDIRNPANWTPEVLYAGEADMYSAIKITDSAGVVDTMLTVQSAFASKIVGMNFDLDGDGKQDIVLPYQATNDSITVTTLTWNGSTTQFDTVITKVVNPKNWGLRVVEGSAVSTGVEVKDWTVITPEQYQLEQNFPNPFNPSTAIRFTLPVQQRISLKVYDLNGRLVRTLVNAEEYAAGSAEIVWDGRNSAGQTVASGTYFYTLSWGNFAKTMKMTLLK